MNACLISAGYVELLIETNEFEIMHDSIVDIVGVSVCVNIVEEIGVVSFRDANFILTTNELQSSVGKLFESIYKLACILLYTRSGHTCHAYGACCLFT